MTTSPAATDSPPVRRQRGRPRDPRVEGVVLGATRDLLLERGFGGLTIAAVADAAGVGKGTIYLRWPDKESLVVAALAEVWEPVADPATDSLRGDLLAITAEVASAFNGTAGRLFTSVIGEMTRHEALQKVWVTSVVDSWDGVMRKVFARGVDRGEMREGIDLDVAINALLGPVLSISAVRGETITPAQVETFVDIYLRGVSA